MQMLYDSDSFTVVAIDLGDQGGQGGDGTPAPARGGYEIVDKFARTEIFLEGLLAERFQQGVQALVERGPTEEEMDDFIGSFSGLAPQPLLLH